MALLPPLEVLTFDQACEIIHYYILRWLVERFHFVLKPSKTAKWLTYVGRGRPELPCTVAFEPYE